MEVTVEFVGWIKQYLQLSSSQVTINLPTCCTIQNMMERMSVPVDLPQTILLNGKPSDMHAYLKDGDQVQFLPMICGG